MGQQLILKDAEWAILEALNQCPLGLEGVDAARLFRSVPPTDGFSLDRLGEAVTALELQGLVARVDNKLKLTPQGYLCVKQIMCPPDR